MFTIRAPLAALALTGAALSAQAADALTVAQVEKITGLTGLKVEPSKYDKGGISFMAGKDLVVAVKQESADAYAVWKEQGARGDQQPLAGVGGCHHVEEGALRLLQEERPRHLPDGDAAEDVSDRRRQAARAGEGGGRESLSGGRQSGRRQSAPRGARS